MLYRLGFTYTCCRMSEETSIPANFSEEGRAASDRLSTTPDEEIKDPYVLEFLGLKDEFSETELENALIGKLQAFLLELGGDFTFVGRQHRLRVGDEWYRVDLLFFHRRLRCLVIIDLKLGKLTRREGNPQTGRRSGRQGINRMRHQGASSRSRRAERPISRRPIALSGICSQRGTRS